MPIERIAKLLGHKDTQTTLIYLGITLAQAQDDARRHDLFAPGTGQSITSTRKRGSLTDSEIDRIAERLVERLAKAPENLDFGDSFD